MTNHLQKLCQSLIFVLIKVEFYILGIVGVKVVVWEWILGYNLAEVV